MSHYLKSKSSKIYTSCCLFIVFLYLLTENSSVSIYELVADPNEVGGVAAYTGLVSTLGILIFGSTASVCLFTAYTIGKIGRPARKWQIFLQISGLFILLLLADDLWQLHESFPALLFGNLDRNDKLQNLGEGIIFGFYALLFGLYLIRFKTLFLQTRLTPLLISILFFSISTIIDLWLKNMSGHFILEEGFKLLGIVSLAMYYFEVCDRQIEQLFKQCKGNNHRPETLN